MTAEQIRHARDLLTRPDNTVSSIARLLGVSRATIYKYVPEVTAGRVAAALPLDRSSGPGHQGAADGMMTVIIIPFWPPRGDRRGGAGKDREPALGNWRRPTGRRSSG